MSPYREITENVGRSLYLLGVNQAAAYEVGQLFASTVQAILKAKAEEERHSPPGRSAPSIEFTTRIGLATEGARE